MNRRLQMGCGEPLRIGPGSPRGRTRLRTDAADVAPACVKPAGAAPARAESAGGAAGAKGRKR
ncbi:MAG: hypothetical protein PVF91_12355 [Chromatiales bacterium]|jgi:hypothetical protein